MTLLQKQEYEFPFHYRTNLSRARFDEKKKEKRKGGIFKVFEILDTKIVLRSYNDFRRCFVEESRRSRVNLQVEFIVEQSSRYDVKVSWNFLLDTWDLNSKKLFSFETSRISSNDALREANWNDRKKGNFLEYSRWKLVTRRFFGLLGRKRNCLFQI